MPLRLLFSGDMSFTGIYRKKVLANEEIFSSTLLALFRESHFTIVNFEGPATSEKNELRQDVFVVNPPQSISYATARHINVFNLANNHIFDCGAKGFTDTVSEIAKQNVSHFGAGLNLDDASNILYLQAKEVSVALIGISHEEGMVASAHSPGIFCETSASLLKARVVEARKRADWIVLNYHGGEEFTTIPMPRRRRLLHKYLELDVDFVIAHHPHVLQGYERVGKKLVFYSLGNFVFDIPGHRDKQFTDTSALLQLDLTKNDYEFRFVPTRLDLVKGTVEEAPRALTERIEHLSNFEDYWSAWLSDAYRAFFQPHMQGKPGEGNNSPPSSRNSPLSQRLLKPKFYTTIYRLLRGRNSRPVFLGALVFLLLKKLNLS